MKYLYFMEQTDGAFDAAQDAVCYPVSNFRGFGSTASTTTLGLHFGGLLGQDEDAFDVVTLTVTANKQKEVMETIVQAINYGKEAFVVVSDDSNSIFISPDVTGCAVSVTAVD
tara:strand:+ start:2095 stop:2433 length:339 start_codon:yes stop_codon:yes gene_type:complete